MAAFVPFTAHIKVIPSRGPVADNGVGKRGGKWDYVRSLQRLATIVYEELTANATAITLAGPGGGQSQLQYPMSDYAPGVAAKPQFGQNPAQLMVTGFYTTNATNLSDQPNNRHMVFHAGRVVNGYGGEKPWLGSDGQAVAVVQLEVCTLKALIETAISAVADDSGNSLEVFRLYYKGVIYGDRGHTYPKCPVFEVQPVIG